MTETQSNVPTPPGWYRDPAGAPLVRWWTGHDWTENTAPFVPPTSDRPTLPEDAPIYSSYIWLVTILPVLTVPLIFLINPITFIALGSTPSSQAIQDATTSFLLDYLLIILSGWVVTALCVVFSYLDWRQLRRQGVVRPFHWAWSFLSSVVYVIGRSVIVRKVAAGRGLAPVWVMIVVLVLAFAITLAWTIMFMSTLFQFIYNGGYGNFVSA